MLVSEIFLSIQGESSFIGYPTIFVRFYGCNMRCSWCDSKYAVEGGKLGEDCFEMSVNEVYDAILALGESAWHVCFTGGEPTLQKDLTQLLDKIWAATAMTMSIETDGGTDLTRLVMDYGTGDAHHVIMDIKLPGSGMNHLVRWENLKLLRPGIDQVKFVISDRKDFDVALALLKEHKETFKHLEILFSPVQNEMSVWNHPFHNGNVPLTVEQGLTYKELVGWMLESELPVPVRFQPQLHKIIWPDKHKGF